MKLRPEKFDDIIGQVELIKRLKILVDSAKKRSDFLPHILFDGQAGLGKTSFACVIANELGEDIQIANGAQLRSIKHAVPYLLKASDRSILFIDEIHRMTKIVEECMYPAMEDFRIDIVNKEGEGQSFDLKRFTFIGATTIGGALSKPFYDRFIIKENLSPYSDEEMSQLINLNATKLDLNIEQKAVYNLAKRSRGTPRCANNLLIWIRDVKTSKGHPIVTNNILNDCMEMVGIDSEGLDKNDRLYLTVLKTRFKNGPVGIKTLIAALNISEETVLNSIEPFLIYKGFVNKTMRGRVYVGPK